MKFWPQLQGLGKEQNLLPELRAQLAKDLQVDLDSVPQFNLQDWLSNWIEKEWNRQDWPQLLYRIDVRVASAERPEEIAQSILEREAQKVIFRAQYSGRL